MRSEEVPVLVVGGGGAGLTASMLLAAPGRRPPPHQREAADLGPAEGARAQPARDGGARGLSASPTRSPSGARRPSHMAATAYYAGFAGPEPEYGRRLARLEAGGGGRTTTGARRARGAAQPPQIRLEPILKAGAETLSPGRVRFNHELLELEQDEDGVQALVRDNGTGEEYVVRCRVPARCGRRTLVREQDRRRYEGLGVLTQTATLHVTADFSRWADDPDVLIRWIASPQAGALIVMVPMGPERWGPTPRSGSSTSTTRPLTPGRSRTSRSRPTFGRRSGSPTPR